MKRLERLGKDKPTLLRAESHEVRAECLLDVSGGSDGSESNDGFSQGCNWVDLPFLEQYGTRRPIRG